MKKRLAMLLLSGAMVMTSLTGCGELKDNEVVVTIDDTEVTADVANFFARYMQAQYEMGYGAYMGEDMWVKEAEEGKTYEEVVKKGLIQEIENLCLMEKHMDDYNVTISKEEEKAIHDAAVKFDKDNKEEDKKKVSGSAETVEKFLRMMTIGQKVEEKMRSEISVKVTDEEAAQKKMQYVSFPFVTTNDSGEQVTLSDNQKADMKLEAEDFAKEAAKAEDFAAYAEQKGYTATDATFDKDTQSSVPKELVTEADKLKEGETTKVVEDPNGYYVAKLVSLFDEEATQVKKSAIAQQRQDDKVQKILKSWRKDASIKVHKNVWNKISFEKLDVSIKTDGQQQPVTIPAE